MSRQVLLKVHAVDSSNCAGGVSQSRVVSDSCSVQPSGAKRANMFVLHTIVCEDKRVAPPPVPLVRALVTGDGLLVCPLFVTWTSSSCYQPEAQFFGNLRGVAKR
ncbi:unnamed protein product [Effrenium voratum]|nr:unnamed protein product [Effrenium voratum]